MNKSKDFLKVIFDKEEGFEIPIRLQHKIVRNGDVVNLVTRYTPISRKLEGYLEVTTPLIKRQSPIIKSG